MTKDAAHARRVVVPLAGIAGRPTTKAKMEGASESNAHRGFTTEDGLRKWKFFRIINGLSLISLRIIKEITIARRRGFGRWSRFEGIR